jgi:hypothetical protein
MGTQPHHPNTRTWVDAAHLRFECDYRGKTSQNFFKKDAKTFFLIYFSWK